MIKQNEYGEPEGDLGEVLELYAQIDALSKLTFLPRKTNRSWYEDGKDADLKALRSLFKEWGLKGISVRRSQGAMCWYPKVKVPRIRRGTDTDGIDYYYEREEAVNKLREAVEQVYPCFATDYGQPWDDYCRIYCTFS